MDLAALVRNVPDFPIPGIQFKDITTVLEDGDALRYITDQWKARYEGRGITAIVGVEARGFIFGGALAYAMGLGFVPARKPGKLPYKTISESYALEYGMNELHMHVDALTADDRVVIIDDLLATGGTVHAVCKLVERLGAAIEELAFVIELPPLRGREKLEKYPVHTMIEFMVE